VFTNNPQQLFFPDLPESTKAPYLSKEEIQLAIDRVPPKRRDGHRIEIHSLAKRLLKTPDLYVSWFGYFRINRLTLAMRRYILTLYSVIGSALEAIVVQVGSSLKADKAVF
jgi:ACS family pantothenate transporter-like MFS transporter